jgi:hypothetical protein
VLIGYTAAQVARAQEVKEAIDAGRCSSSSLIADRLLGWVPRGRRIFAKPAVTMLISVWRGRVSE